jgi:hypothetical protein
MMAMLILIAAGTTLPGAAFAKIIADGLEILDLAAIRG